MTRIIETPNFKNEAEEASWWDAHPDAAFGVLEQAAKEGTLGQGPVARRSGTAATSIRLDTADIELAKLQAEKRGLRYQTYLKMLIHQALASEARSSVGSSIL